MAVSRAKNLNMALVGRMNSVAKRHGIKLDTFDMDLIVGAAQEWLAENNAALTGRGVRRFRKKSEEKKAGFGD